MGAYSKLHNYLYRKIKWKFPHLYFSENAHPEWLTSESGTRLELDIFIEDLSMAAEIQGQQHYRFVEHFHKTYDEYEKLVRYDERKRTLCRLQGIKLFEISNEFDADVFISEIDKIINPEIKTKYYYQETVIIYRGNRALFSSKTNRRLIDPNFEKNERLQRCKDKLVAYEKGLIDATQEKIQNGEIQSPGTGAMTHS